MHLVEMPSGSKAAESADTASPPVRPHSGKTRNRKRGRAGSDQDRQSASSGHILEASARPEEAGKDGLGQLKELKLEIEDAELAKGRGRGKGRGSRSGKGEGPEEKQEMQVEVQRTKT